MAAKASRLQPEHPNWNEDLPEREAATHRQPPDLGGQLNAIDEMFLELGRVPILVRGLFLALAPLFLVPIWPLLTLLVSGIPRLLEYGGEVVVVVGSLLMLPALVAVLTWSIRFDTTLPRQTPVRFSRATGKVYWNGYKHTWNPFGKWGTVLKVWDWSTVQAEIHKTAGFNGKVYQVRYTLQLATCKPGTFEVVDREVLMSPSMTTVEFERVWAYLCKYMGGGKNAVPAEPVQDNSVHYIRSLLTFYEWALPGQWGAQARKDMFGQGVVVAVVSAAFAGATLVAAPLFLPLGATNYLALKWAPLAVWPPEMDAESRGISMDELARLKAEERAQPKEKAKPASVVAALVTLGLLAWFLYRVW